MRRAFHIFLILWGVLLFHGPQIYLMLFLQFTKAGPGGLANFFIDLALFLGWAGIHSLMARSFFKNAIGRLVGEDLVKLVYVTIAGITQTAMIFFWRPLPGVIWETSGPAYYALTALFLLSVGFISYSCLLLDYMEVLGVRAVIRRMNKQPRKPHRLLLRGPYAHCRHPVYLGTIAFLWIGPVMTTSRLIFAILGTAYLFIGTWLEEKNAAAEMGADWQRYRENVPMWLPRLTPWRP